MIHDQQINMTERLNSTRHQLLGVRRIAKVQLGVPNVPFCSTERSDHAFNSCRVSTPALFRIVWRPGLAKHGYAFAEQAPCNREPDPGATTHAGHQCNRLYGTVHRVHTQDCPMQPRAERQFWRRPDIGG